MIQNINTIRFLSPSKKGEQSHPNLPPLRNRDFSSRIRSRVCKTDSTDACKYWNTIYLFTNRNAKVYSHESTWRGWKTRGLAHRFPLRKLSLRRSSSLNHLTESSPRSTTRPLRLASSRVLCCPFPTVDSPQRNNRLSFNRNGKNRARFIWSKQVARWIQVLFRFTGDFERSDNKR